MLTTQQVAERLGVSRARVQQLTAEGRLAGSRLGNFWVYEEKTVEDFARQERPVGRPPAAEEEA